MKCAGAIPLTSAVESRRRSNSARPLSEGEDVILFILLNTQFLLLLLRPTHNKIYSRPSKIMTDEEKNKDERATALATQAVKFVASGQIEVDWLLPSEAYYSH